MLPYEYVKSIHDQKMAQFVAQREKDELVRMLNAGRPGAVKRLAQAVRALGEAYRRSVRPAI